MINRFSIFFCSVLFVTAFAKCQETGTFHDSRDNHEYKWVKIGSQIWMAENLAFLPTVTQSAHHGRIKLTYNVYNYHGVNLNEAKESPNYKMYGVLYNAESAQSSCPEGWHLPSDYEWKELETFLGMDIKDLHIQGYRYSGEVSLKMKSTLGWTDDSNGNNESGLNVLPAGLMGNEGSFSGLGHSTRFWTSSQNANKSNWIIGVRELSTSDAVKRGSGIDHLSYSIRCVKGTKYVNSRPSSNFAIIPRSGPTETTFTFDPSLSLDKETPLDLLEFLWDFTNDGHRDNITNYLEEESYRFAEPGVYLVSLKVIDEEGAYDIHVDTVFVTESVGGKLPDGSFVDYRDGKEYKFVKFGDQVWMAENLAYLPNINDPMVFMSTYDPCYYVFGYNDMSLEEVKSKDNYNERGVLYNWSASLVSCPEGWRLPSVKDFEKMLQFLYPEDNSYDVSIREENLANMLRSTTGWGNKNNNGNNNSGFNAFKTGYVGRYGGWVDWEAYFWCNDTVNIPEAPSAKFFGLKPDKFYFLSLERKSGLSVRCVKE
jgi:uncharacterized protein (TIGR02145 family)